MMAPRPLTIEELTAAEHDVLAILQSGVDGTTVTLCDGGGRVGTTSRNLVVPRASLALSAGSDLALKDQGWAYPLLLALDTGWEPTAACRERWLQMVGFQ